MEADIPQTAHDLFATLRGRRTHETEVGTRHLVAVADTDSMLYWLARAAQRAREERGRKPVHIAASASVDQSTITRFEKGRAWPDKIEEIVNAYAADLEIPAVEIWAAAVDLWRLSAAPGERFADELDHRAQPSPAPARAPGTGNRGNRRGSPGR